MATALIAWHEIPKVDRHIFVTSMEEWSSGWKSFVHSASAATADAASALLREHREPYPHVWLVWEVLDDGRVILHMAAETEERAQRAEKSLREGMGKKRICIEQTVMNHLYGESLQGLVNRTMRKEPTAVPWNRQPDGSEGKPCRECGLPMCNGKRHDP